jgi:hypothetical protein
MALIGCPDCGKDISTAAPACPWCGRPGVARPGVTRAVQGAVQTTAGSKFLDPAENARGCLRIVLVLFILLFVLPVGCICIVVLAKSCAH